MNTATKATDSGSAKSEDTVTQLAQIHVSNLAPFKNHIFKPYSKQRMKTLVASVQENGIIHPIIVRRMKTKDNQDKFEIVSGHNRFEAAKLAGLEEVPAVVKELSDDGAIILANEANIESRNFSMWLPSEKIKSIEQYHLAVKNQGKSRDPKTTASGGNRQRSEDNYARQRTAEVYGQSPSIIRLFIELSRLSESLQDRLDAEDFGTTSASELSFISTKGQGLIDSVLGEDKDKKLYKVTVQRSKQLRNFFENDVAEPLTADKEEAIKDAIRKMLGNSKEPPSQTATDDSIKIPILQVDYTELFPNTPSPEDAAEYLVKCARHCIEHNVFMGG